ncbi:unnamed protein product [Nippostrongylus brasiliensis]|uniref:DBR1 domain-containing protein n=1 Tax=Nippostrongylus brasiliensis TaxID=27835 RepID=A0A0N4YDV6_NIPBR|nr:unnamed protein product [Nippostrongylus brasiliensis]
MIEGGDKDDFVPYTLTQLRNGDVCSDDQVRKYKGGPLVMTFDERWASVEECKYVDNVIDHGMFYPTIKLLNDLQPFKDADRFLTTQRTENISTTDLIQRIVDQCDQFRERNVKREKYG